MQAWERTKYDLQTTLRSLAILWNATLKNGLVNFNTLSKEDCLGYQMPLRKNGNRALYYFFTQTCHQLPDDYHHQLLPGLNILAHIVWGVQDEILVWEKMAKEVKLDLRIPSEHIHLSEKAKYFIQEEMPDLIVKVIQQAVHR